MNKDFSIIKKGYNKQEVDNYILNLENTISLLKQENATLTSNLEENANQLSALRQKQDLIVKSIMGAMQKAEQIENLTRQKYEFDMQQLNAFHERWLNYYNKLIAQFPLSNQLRGLNSFNKAMSKLLGNSILDSNLISQIDCQIEQAQDQYLNSQQLNEDYVDFQEQIPTFNPKETIKNLLNQTPNQQNKKQKQVKNEAEAKSQNENESFSYEEALNPTQSLSQILKELGLD